jgi:hypothetical protein
VTTHGRQGAGDATAAEVLVCGPAYCDLLFAGLEALPALGTERFAQGFLITAGGSAITAVALRRLGRPTALLADVGADAHGDVVRRVLLGEGVETRWLRERSDAPTPVTAVLSTPGDRAFVTYLAPDAEPPDLEAALTGSGARHLHVGGFPAALRIPHLVDVARSHGATVSFDPGWDERALDHPRVREVASRCDVLLPSRNEALRLADLVDDGPDAARRAAAALARLRPETVTVVKDGARGAWGAGPDACAHVAPPPVTPRDPTGAGDVFDAGFLDAWLAGEPLAACLRRGAASGARAVTARGGATAAPTAVDLARALAETPPATPWQEEPT